MPRRLALTGPAGASIHGLDGFRDLAWPPLWCSPPSGAPADRVLRTRAWSQPVMIDHTAVAPVPLVLRHLGAVPEELSAADDLDPLDRIELAVEHALRSGVEVGTRRGCATPGDQLLREVLHRRGSLRPTDSYAETRLIQRLRSWGLTAWRQVEVWSNETFLYRADLCVPFDQSRPEPVVVGPLDGVLLEVDSEEHHAEQFHRDQHRNSTYDRLAFHWLAVSPRQIERQPLIVRRALDGVLARGTPGGKAKIRTVDALCTPKPGP